MIARLMRAAKTHRLALPWVLLKKLMAPYLKTETFIIYGRSLRAGAAPLSGKRGLVAVVRIVDSHSTLSSKLCSAFPECDFAVRLQEPGRQCYVALLDGDVSGYAWVANDGLRIDEISFHYPIGRRDVFIYNCFVKSACRGKGIYQAMLRAIVEDCGDRDALPQRALIAASSLNRASISGICKAGFIELKRINYLAWGERRRWSEKETFPGREAENAKAGIDGEF